MKRTLTLYRLLLRPWVVAGSGYLIALAAMLPLWGVRDETGSLLTMWQTHTATPEVLNVLWRVAIILPFGVGIALGTGVDELRKAMISCSLPALGARLRNVAFPLPILVTLVVAIPHWRLGGWMHAIGVSGIALLASAIAIALPTPRYAGARRYALLLIVGALVWPEWLEAIARASAGGVAIVAYAAAIMLLADAFSRRATRSYLVAMTAGLSHRSSTADRNGVAVTWAPLQTGGLLDAMRATAYSTGMLTRRRLVGSLFGYAYNAAAAYTLGSPLFIAFAMFHSPAQAVGHPAGVLLSPVSRLRRAQVCYWMNVVTVVCGCVLGAGALLLLQRLQLWPLLNAGGSHRLAVVPVVALIAAFAPAALWIVSRPPAFRAEPTAASAMRILLAGYLPFIALVMTSVFLYDARMATTSVAVRLVAILALIAITQSLFYVYLRRAFARRDLV